MRTANHRKRCLRIHDRRGRRQVRQGLKRLGTLRGIVATLLALISTPTPGFGQQVADNDFVVRVPRPAFGREGPIVAVDAAHHNFHTIRDRYLPFAEILRADGYRVVENDQPFTLLRLQGFQVLVIANAGSDDESTWRLPTPAAFSEAEVEVVATWVESGGALLLIADHMPAAGAATSLAARFGIHMTNGFTRQERPPGMPGDIFERARGTLWSHPVTEGRSDEERIDFVVSFTGQAFQASAPVDTLLSFEPDAWTLLPVDAEAVFDNQTPRVHSGGWLHGATRRVGKGRIAVFGEAAMFSAQVAGRAQRPMGLNHPKASQNQQFLLNVMHWLSGVLD